MRCSLKDFFFYLHDFSLAMPIFSPSFAVVRIFRVPSQVYIDVCIFLDRITRFAIYFPFPIPGKYNLNFPYFQPYLISIYISDKYHIPSAFIADIQLSTIASFAKRMDYYFIELNTLKELIVRIVPRVLRYNQTRLNIIYWIYRERYNILNIG